MAEASLLGATTGDMACPWRSGVSASSRSIATSSSEDDAALPRGVCARPRGSAPLANDASGGSWQWHTRAAPTCSASAPPGDSSSKSRGAALPAAAARRDATSGAAAAAGQLSSGAAVQDCWSAPRCTRTTDSVASGAHMKHTSGARSASSHRKACKPPSGGSTCVAGKRERGKRAATRAALGAPARRSTAGAAAASWSARRAARHRWAAQPAGAAAAACPFAPSAPPPAPRRVSCAPAGEPVRSRGRASGSCSSDHSSAAPGGSATGVVSSHGCTSASSAAPLRCSSKPKDDACIERTSAAMGIACASPAQLASGDGLKAETVCRARTRR